MAHTNQERWATLVDAKLRSQLVTRDNLIFNNRYEGDPKAGKVKIPVRDTEVAVKTYNKSKGVDASEGSTAYIDLSIDHDEAVNELIDGFDAASVPDGIVAERLDSAGYSLALSIDKASIQRARGCFRRNGQHHEDSCDRDHRIQARARSKARIEPQRRTRRRSFSHCVAGVPRSPHAGRTLYQAGRPLPDARAAGCDRSHRGL